MYTEYFVLVTDKFFGIFRIDANHYPEVFKQNLHCVKCVEEQEIEQYLLQNVGRNCLVKSGFKMYAGFGRIYSRCS